MVEIGLVEAAIAAAATAAVAKMGPSWAQTKQEPWTDFGFSPWAHYERQLETR